MNEVKKIIPEFSIGEIVRARDRLWRIDQIHKVEKEIKKVKKNFIYYSVSNITGQPSSEVLIPNIEEIKKEDVPRPSPNKLGSPIYQKLLLDAIKLDLIYGTTSFISLQNSKVIPVSYQMVPVLMALNLKKVRLLLADDVGLGKTIEAGLILQELLGRKKINRVLFVTPASLREQWRGILKSFFGIDAVIMSSRNRRRLESELLVDGNPWGYYNFVITSTDYAKQSEVKYEILQFDWDMIVIDEGHNVMLPHLGIIDATSVDVKKSYSLAKALADESKFPHFLLLTATPHNGYKDSFASLLQMINPKIISNNNLKKPEIDRELAAKHICQRRRKDVEQWILSSSHEKSPFPIRNAEEKFIEPSQQFYNTLELLSVFLKHIINCFKDKPQKQKKFSYWTILHFIKRMISSPHALSCSIDRRLDGIDEKLQKKNAEIEKPRSSLSLEEAAQTVVDGHETDKLSEEERDEKTDKIVLTRDLNELQTEKRLLTAVKKTIPTLKQKDKKMKRLLDDVLPAMFKKSKKVIIFTRYLDTLSYIEENLKLRIKDKSLRYKDFKIFSIHGRLASQKRQDVYNGFLKEKQAILVTTDCMAEGIDLQFSANQLINYELTWNPNRLEQRNGRIDRFGQPSKKVYIRTFIMENTLEMDILELIVKKANEIKEDYGFVPGFFGEPETVIDHIMARSKNIARIDGTLNKWIKFTDTILEDLVSIFFSKSNVEAVLKDSFYGQNNINLDEIERRMRLTRESIGDDQTLREFLEGAVKLYSGKIEPLDDDEDEVYQLVLPDKIKKDIGVEFEGYYKFTTNMKTAAGHGDVEGINLKNILVSGLIEKVKNEAFSERHDFYGRTAAFSSSEITDVSVIFNVKIRYVVNTEPKSLMEEIAQVGVELFNPEVKLTEVNVNKIWASKWENHDKNEKYVEKHLKKALELKNLDNILKELSQERKQIIVKERKDMIQSLKEQGVAADLDGIDNIDAIGVDLLTITLIYPKTG